MLCEECHENEAELLVTEVDSEGKLKEKQLCKVCAAKKGLTSTKQKPVTEKFADFLAEKPSGDDVQISCPRCGMSWADFRKHGRFGCEHCYSSFSGKVEKMVGKIQSTTQHTGRKPSSQVSGGQVQKELEVKKLRKELAQAIQDEEYEKAARIRDNLRRAEKGGMN